MVISSEANFNVGLLKNGLEKYLGALDSGELGGIYLRDGQREILDVLIDGTHTDKAIANGYFHLPTGVGKTVLFSIMTAGFLNEQQNLAKEGRKKVLILVPRLALIPQTIKRLETYAGAARGKIAQFSSDKKSRLSDGTENPMYKYLANKDGLADADVVVTTYQSLSALVDEGAVNPADFALVIPDEAHWSLSGKRQDALSKFGSSVVLSFTATPDRDEKAGVKNSLGGAKLLYKISLKEAVETGLVAPITYNLFVSTLIVDEKKTDSADEFTRKINSSLADNKGLLTFQEEIAKKILMEGSDYNAAGELVKFKNLKAMINCNNIVAAESQAEVINKIFGKNIARAIHSESYSFAEDKKAFENNEFQIVCQVGTLTEGFDDEQISLVVNYPSFATIRIEQGSGRCIRKNKNDENKVAFVVDTMFRASKSGDDINSQLSDVVDESLRRALYTYAMDGEVYLGPARPEGGGGGSREKREPKEITSLDGVLISDELFLKKIFTEADKRRIENDKIRNPRQGMAYFCRYFEFDEIRVYDFIRGQKLTDYELKNIGIPELPKDDLSGEIYYHTRQDLADYLRENMEGLVTLDKLLANHDFDLKAVIAFLSKTGKEEIEKIGLRSFPTTRSDYSVFMSAREYYISKDMQSFVVDYLKRNVKEISLDELCKRYGLCEMSASCLLDEIGAEELDKLGTERLGEEYCVFKNMQDRLANYIKENAKTVMTIKDFCKSRDFIPDPKEILDCLRKLDAKKKKEIGFVGWSKIPTGWDYLVYRDMAGILAGYLEENLDGALTQKDLQATMLLKDFCEENGFLLDPVYEFLIEQNLSAGDCRKIGIKSLLKGGGVDGGRRVFIDRKDALIDYLKTKGAKKSLRKIEMSGTITINNFISEEGLNKTEFLIFLRQLKAEWDSFGIQLKTQTSGILLEDKQKLLLERYREYEKRQQQLVSEREESTMKIEEQIVSLYKDNVPKADIARKLRVSDRTVQIAIANYEVELRRARIAALCQGNQNGN